MIKNTTDKALSKAAAVLISIIVSTGAVDVVRPAAIVAPAAVVATYSEGIR